MAWYDIGTVSVTNGSTTVTGSGTNFIAGAQIGEAFYGPDERLYEIQAIVSATVLTLGSPYLGSTQTGQAYYIIPTQSLVATLANEVSSLITDFQSVADLAGAGKFANGTAALPGITFNLDQDTGFSRPAANQIGFSTAGVQRALLSSTALTLNVPISGTTGTFSGDATIHGATVGRGAGAISTNTAVGSGSLSSNTTGNNNTAVGHLAMRDITTGLQNVAIGQGALRNSTTGVSNTAIGFSSAINATSDNNTAVGRFALRNLTTGSGNIALGTGAGDADLGDNNTIIGRITGTAGLANTVIIGAGTQERLRIDSAGNVGIGTSSPTSALTVQGRITGTAVTQNATDTTAERLTKVGDFGLGLTESPFAAATDLDTDFRDANYYGLRTVTSSNTGYPTGFSVNNAVLSTVRRSTGDRGVQILYGLGGTTSGSNAGLMMRVFRNDANPDGDFQEFYNTHNILGTVSQSSGVPTGAIIQRGSNTNGEFVRFADGTQICTNDTVVGSVDVNVASGSLFRSGGAATWTFPAAFINGANTNVFAEVSTGLAAFINLMSVRPAGISATSNAFVFYASVSGTYVDVPIKRIAIGRWF